MTWAQASARRLARNGLSAPLPSVAEAAAAMCGAHAQVLSAGEISLSLRVDGVTRVDVQRSVWQERSVVKTRGPRGTVHLLAARDLPMWTGALSDLPLPPHITGRNALMTPAQTDEVVAAVADALADAELTRDELTDEVVARTGSWAGDRVMDAFQDKWPRWVQAMDIATNRGALCFGPNRGRKTTYTSPARWLPGFAPARTEQAKRELLHRFLHAYGPATPAQFARWLAAPKTWVTKLFDATELEPVELEGEQAWVNPGDIEAPGEPPQGVRLLPYFDAFGIGCFPRERLFPGRAFERALARGQAGNYPVLLVDGVVAGVWHQRRSGKRVALTVEPIGTLTARQRAGLEEQAHRLGEITAGSVELTIGEVTSGPHA